MGRSKNATVQPCDGNCSMRKTWCTYLRARRSGAVTTTRANSASAARAHLVEPWSAQACPAVAGIAEDGALIYRCSLAGAVALQPLQRLLDGLRLGLPTGL